MLYFFFRLTLYNNFIASMAAFFLSLLRTTFSGAVDNVDSGEYEVPLRDPKHCEVIEAPSDDVSQKVGLV